MIDLRSDTVTRPTEAMRAAMASAEVGDDVFGDDPTVNALERRVAELLGKEDAVYVPSGTMANQVAVRSQTTPGDRVAMEAEAHIRVHESGAPAALAGVTIAPIPGHYGVFSAEQLTAVTPSPPKDLPVGLHDPVTLVAALHPELFEMEEMAGDVETGGNLSSGATIFDRRAARQWRNNMEVATSVDVAAVMDCILRGLNAVRGS